eukprot:1996721-Amphidinium_carterae.1
MPSICTRRFTDHVSFLITLEVFHGNTTNCNGLLGLVRFDPVQLGVGREGQPSWHFEMSVARSLCRPLYGVYDLSGALAEP